MIECNICHETFYSHTALSEHYFKAHGNGLMRWWKRVGWVDDHGRKYSVSVAGKL